LLAAAASLPARAEVTPARPSPRRILSIHALEPGLPAESQFAAGLRATLPLGTELELYTEHLDRLRFADASYVDGLREWLRKKYAAAPPDVLVAAGPGALAFLSDPATTPFPGVPVVFGMVPEGAVPERLPGYVTGAPDRFAIRETLELALALFPETRRVALVGGASRADRAFNDLLRREVAGAERRVEVVELFGLPMAELVERLRAQPPGTVVLALSFLQDGAGRMWGGPLAGAALTATDTPIFTFTSHMIGFGVVGGVMTDLQENGERVAQLVLRLLAGERVADVPIQRGPPGRALLDGRALDRFGVPDARVPAGVEVRYRGPSVWVRYRLEILLAAGAIVVQTVLIVLLLVEHRRRARAEAKARENLALMARMNRLSALGELVVSLAHEINSPLGAALNNAEAAERYLAMGGQEAEVRACLEDIVRDTARAGEVLRRIRGVLQRDAREPAPVDVAQAVRDAVHLVRHDAKERAVTLEVAVAFGLPAVLGDDVQLVQVLLNLLVNALDAVAAVPPERRLVRVGAVTRGAHVAIRVEDSGPGIPPSLAATVFEPFVTTKPSGLGMGLAISRSIVEAHHGSIAVLRSPLGGAAFDVVLPATRDSAIGERSRALG
jgi:signal transduction histidine kinase